MGPEGGWENPCFEGGVSRVYRVVSSVREGFLCVELPCSIFSSLNPFLINPQFMYHNSPSGKRLHNYVKSRPIIVR